MSGPAYETPTEVGFLQQAGATVVGMSMVPESLPPAPWTCGCWGCVR